MKRFFKANILNCIIYIIAILMSLICPVLYFVECEKSDELKNFFLSIGTSIFASALLAFTIEYSNYMRFEKRKSTFRQNKLYNFNQYLNFFCERFCNLIFRSFKLWYEDTQGQPQEKTLQQWMIEAKELFDEIEKNKEGKEQCLSRIVELINEIFVSRGKVLRQYIDELAPYFLFWEQSDYFNNEDIKHLRNIAIYCDNLLYDYNLCSGVKYFDYKEFYNQVEILFSEIFAINEFTSLQNTSFNEQSK